MQGDRWDSKCSGEGGVRGHKSSSASSLNVCRQTRGGEGEVGGEHQKQSLQRKNPSKQFSGGGKSVGKQRGGWVKRCGVQLKGQKWENGLGCENAPKTATINQPKGRGGTTLISYKGRKWGYRSSSRSKCRVFTF